MSDESSPTRPTEEKSKSDVGSQSKSSKKKAKSSSDAASSADPPQQKQKPKSKPKQEDHKTKSKQEEEPKPNKVKPINESEKNIPLPQKKGTATVKAVLSGDSFSIYDVMGNYGVPLERQITISGIQAPRFARGRNAQDESFAWESREFLRRKIIGAKITYTVAFAAEGRDYATVLLDQENIGISIVRAGWASVKQSNQTSREGRIHPEKEALLQAEEAAKNEGIGIHRLVSQPRVRRINWNPDRSFFKNYQDVPIPAIVDYVRDGSTLRCELLMDRNNLQHTMINLHLAGVQCLEIPLQAEHLQQQLQRKHQKKVKKEENEEGETEEKGKEKEEDDDRSLRSLGELSPLALEAQFFTEQRLLNRDVHVVMQVMDKSNIYGTVLFPKGNITERLLEQGLGHFVEWTAQATTIVPLPNPNSAVVTPNSAKGKQYQTNHDRLLQAEQSAKKNRLGRWKTYNESKKEEKKTSEESDQYRVVQVMSGDTLLIADSKGVEQKVSLSSIQAPKLSTNRRAGIKDEAYAWEAREFLRGKLIGQKIKMTIDYQREMGMAFTQKQKENQPSSRSYVTIFVNKINLAEALLSQGFASVVRHRKDDNRSPYYDQLLDAEARAADEKKGIHGDPRAAPVHEFIDLSEKFRPTDATGLEKEQIETKQRQASATVFGYLQPLRDAKSMLAIVEYVFSGSRFKLFISSQKLFISFVLSGIKCPPSKTKDGDADPIGELALSFSRRYLQTTVSITVEAMDRADNFVGNLFINKENLAEKLLSEGLAEVFGLNFDPTATSNLKNPNQKFRSKAPPASYYQAQDKAKAARLNIWKNYVEDEVKDEKQVAANSAGASVVREYKDGDEYVNCRVTEITDGITFYVQFIGDKGFSVVEDYMKNFDSNVNVPESWEPERNTVCAGMFHDGSWYRFRVDSHSSTGSFTGTFIDYGNHARLSASSLRPLAREIASIPPLAHECILAGVKPPNQKSEWAPYTMHALHQLSWDKELLGRVEMEYGGKLHLSLFDKATDVSLNSEMLRQGLVRVIEKPPQRLRKLCDVLKADEAIAIKKHVRIWEYGNVSDDEEEDPDAKFIQKNQMEKKKVMEKKKLEEQERLRRSALSKKSAPTDGGEKKDEKKDGGGKKKGKQ